MNLFLAQAIATLQTWETLEIVLTAIKQLLALIGALVILTGAIYALVQFLKKIWIRSQDRLFDFDQIRLDLGRSIVLGLEFIIAADVIETTTTPDYYALGILGLLVVIRTFLNYFLNRDLMELSRQEQVDYLPR